MMNFEATYRMAAAVTRPGGGVGWGGVGGRSPF